MHPSTNDLLEEPDPVQMSTELPLSPQTCASCGAGTQKGHLKENLSPFSQMLPIAACYGGEIGLGCMIAVFYKLFWD